MGFDTRELRQFAADLGVAGAKAVPEAAKVLEVNALRIRKAWRSSARGHARFPSFPASITTDIRGLTAEIGPDKNKRQGALGNLLHFGTSRSGPTLPNPQTYLDAAQPKFETDLAALADRLLGGGGAAPSPDAGDSAPTTTGRDSRGRFVKGG